LFSIVELTIAAAARARLITVITDPAQVLKTHPEKGKLRTVAAVAAGASRAG